MQPILFLGGAPKCGTSAFFDMLAQHPAIAASRPKETFYFMDKTYPLLNQQSNFWKSGIEGFHRFFDQGQDAEILLEGSTHLLFQKDILREVKDLDARFVFILREPAQRVRSSFEYTQNNLARFKKPLDFPDYVQMLLDGRAGELDNFMDASVSRKVLKDELNLSNYYNHLQRWSTHIPASRLYLVLYEDMVKNPAAVAASVCNWLGIDAQSEHFKMGAHNKTQGIRNKALHRILTPVNKMLPSGKLKNVAKQIYFGAQGKAIARNSDHGAALAALKEYFIPTNKKLGAAYNLDLSSWQ